MLAKYTKKTKSNFVKMENGQEQGKDGEKMAEGKVQMSNFSTKTIETVRREIYVQNNQLFAVMSNNLAESTTLILQWREIQRLKVLIQKCHKRHIWNIIKNFGKSPHESHLYYFETIKIFSPGTK